MVVQRPKSNKAIAQQIFVAALEAGWMGREILRFRCFVTAPDYEFAKLCRPYTVIS
jgi:hypothetical protein